ncbi:glycosyltransferase family 4 protein [Thermocrispum municipale]|jgi:glycosyltransferase involved in cell wall biosynthesis|uniref:glycosyltransferase family 4 protein n=1 Tax=Thermocrispum municipale TaxID=37926 RepID=UPI0004191065|nr:glycosyltransferase family 4 protein [Thermocrispum municipale]
MRIAVVNNFYPPRVGGSAHMAESLAKGYVARGHEVLVITAEYPNAPAEETVDGVRIVRLPAFRLPKTKLAVNFDITFATRPSLPKALRRLLGEFQPDVIHQHGQFFDLTWATGMWARKNDVPVLLSVHTRLESPKPMYQAVFSTLDKLLVAPILRRYKPMHVVMDRLMNDYIHKKYKGAISGTVDIPVGLDPTWARSGNPNRMRDELGIGDAPMILSLGHVIPLRDRVTLTEAMPAVLKEIPDAKLVVVGGIYYDAFLKRADELGVRDAIITTGAAPKADVPDYLATADVECHSLQGIGFGTACLETLAAGTPQVAAITEDHFGDIKIIDREHMHLVPVGDAKAVAERLIEVLKNPEEARRMARNGMAIVDQHFSMTAVTEKYLETLQQLAAQRR